MSLSVARWVLVVFATLLFLYHYLIFPRLLRCAAKRRPMLMPTWETPPEDQTLPSVAVIVPAHDESVVIGDKIRNLALLDYPADKLRVILVCDGCTDQTAALARQAASAPECAHLNLELLEYPKSRGKNAALKAGLALADRFDLVAFSDASAICARDVLMRAAAWLAQTSLVAVGGGYEILHARPGESQYWAWQTRNKLNESILAGPIGFHGAWWVARRTALPELPEDTINDDLVWPMMMVAAGLGRLVYDPDMRVYELEAGTPGMDWYRRRRIAAGNLQQLWRLRSLLHPRFGRTAWIFASGKGLRAVLPILLAISGFCALVPPLPSMLQQLLWSGVLLAVLVMSVTRLPLADKLPVILRALGYFLNDYLASLVGEIEYLCGRYRRPWKRAVQDNPHKKGESEVK